MRLSKATKAILEVCLYTVWILLLTIAVANFKYTHKQLKECDKEKQTYKTSYHRPTPHV